MHDIRLIRDDPAAFDTALARRGVAPASPALLALDERRRTLVAEAQVAQTRRNEASKTIGAAKAKGDHAAADALMAEVATLKQRLPEIEAETKAADAALHDALAALPNLPAADVPDGVDEAGNVVVRSDTAPEPAFPMAEHFDLGAPLGLDFEAAAAISGARFAVMRGGIARLHRALGQYMLDVQTQEHGFTEVAPPLLVRDEAVFGTGQLPKFAEDLFRTTDGRWLIPTAEVSLTNLVRETILDATVLPLRFAALTPCFRSEAGAAGRDTRGLIRQHQFDKVEMVAITHPDESDAEQERMIRAAETILERLALPYRRMLLCAGDMGFTARRTFDLEVWLPGQKAWREISSVSTCGDFQARRMDARFRVAGEKGTRFVHTLNGSGLAVGRTLVAVLENHQRADGSIAIPAPLRLYMNNVEAIG